MYTSHQAERARPQLLAALWTAKQRGRWNVRLSMVGTKTVASTKAWRRDSKELSATDGTIFKFEVDAFKKHCLLNGLDDIGLTYQKIESIDKFEEAQAKITPWL